MKKKSIKSLKLSKVKISDLSTSKIVGATGLGCTYGTCPRLTRQYTNCPGSQCAPIHTTDPTEMGPCPETVH